MTLFIFTVIICFTIYCVQEVCFHIYVSEKAEMSEQEPEQQPIPKLDLEFIIWIQNNFDRIIKEHNEKREAAGV